MKTPTFLARAAACSLLAMAGVHAHAHAQQAAQAAADPQAAVPATRYQPVLPARPAPAADADADGSPDRNWVASNRKVAATDSMALTMKPMTGMPGMAGMDMGKQAQAPAMCTPAGAGGQSQGGQCKMGCCASCASCAGMKEHKEAPTADPHAQHRQEPQ